MFDQSEITRNDELRVELLSSFYKFTRVFYKLLTNRDWETSTPIGRESHYISIARALTNVFHHRVENQMIWCPPRYGKSVMCCHFIAWALARYPDCCFIYASYSKDIAAYHTDLVRKILMLNEYQELFDVRISSTTKAKDNFETTAGGAIFGAGVGGSITGKGAGLKNVDRFGGCVLLDDSIKPDEATSDTIREGVNDWYQNTLLSRRNSPDTPFVFIGQRVHENDLAQNLADGFDTYKWDILDLPALDAAGNALNPKMHTKEKLLEMLKVMPYVTSAQYQQRPTPAGGAIFRPEWFVELDNEPQMLVTFETVDTAETEKSYNDATVFSFWGLYYIKHGNVETPELGLHWIDCQEIRIEPKDLEDAYTSFHFGCMRYPVQPVIAGIEKKSTGATLVSVMKEKLRGIRVVEIESTVASGSKTNRFLDAQPYAAKRLISFNKNAKHKQMCIDHMKKITANNTHRFDDIADTLAWAVKMAFIDKTIPYMSKMKTEQDSILEKLAAHHRADIRARNQLYGRGNRLQ